MLLLVAVGSIIACEKGSIEPRQISKTHSDDYHVRPDDIVAYLNQRGSDLSTKAMADVSIEPVVYNSDTVYYIVNYGKGWEVLSADKRAPRVLIQCDGGRITKADLLSSPAQRAFLEALEVNLSKALHDDDFYSNADISDSWLSYDNTDNTQREQNTNKTINSRGLISQERTVISSYVRDHLLSTKWGQGYPWNQRAPYIDSTLTNHCLTGCVPVAAAQVLYYLHYKIGKPVGTYGFSTCNAYIPSDADYLVLSPSDITFSYNAPIHWADLPLTAGSAGQHYKVSTLMMRIGYLYGAKYYRDQTFSSTSKACTYFPSEFSISCSYADSLSLSQLNSISRSQIYDNQLPILMAIYEVVNGEVNSGHSIVLDGYKYLEERVVSTFVYYQLDGTPYIETYTTTEISRYLAINWGWDGSGDSDASGNTIWYNMATPWIVSSYNFNDKNYIVYNFAAIN